MPDPIIWGLTTEEATDLFQCTLCRQEGSGACQDEFNMSDCVESATGSNRCVHCGGRVWFQGSNPTGMRYYCPYCETVGTCK